jgi:hypothetical protein
VHRTTRAVIAERLVAERERMRPLPARTPDADRRFVVRVPAQPYLRFDTNDYSLDPRLAGRRVEVRVSRSEITAVALDTGELACRHRRRFARYLTFTDPVHQRALDELRGERSHGRDVEVELRALARYDALIPARARPPSWRTSSARSRRRPPRGRCQSSPSAPARSSGATSASRRRC